MKPIATVKKNAVFVGLAACFLLLASSSFSQSLTINDSGYFEKPGVNVFVFNGEYNGIFFDEKTAGIKLIHHGPQRDETYVDYSTRYVDIHRLDGKPNLLEQIEHGEQRRLTVLPGRE